MVPFAALRVTGRYKARSLGHEHFVLTIVSFVTLSGLSAAGDPPSTVTLWPTCGSSFTLVLVSLNSLPSSPSIIGTGAGVRLERGAAASPLTRERNSWEAGLGLSWRL
jgi:hypothetical protein